jgi:cleavage stimulation factor subunit 3
VNADRRDYYKSMEAAYDFALQGCGHDKNSGDIWAGYIEFLKKWPRSEADISLQAVRKIYRKAIQFPLENVEQLWKDYNLYESSINPHEVCHLYRKYCLILTTQTRTGRKSSL